jgi:cellulose synthase/poly-beta-1,6-N-acetylglucosamine synthase-like glycosyltransferase
LLRLDAADLCDLLRRLPADEFREALRTRLIKVAVLPGHHRYAACSKLAFIDAEIRGLDVAAYGTPVDFLAAVRAVRGKRLLHEATWSLAERMPELSASQWVTTRQVLIFLFGVVAIAAMAALLPLQASWLILGASGGIFFLSVIMLRLLALYPRMPGREPATRQLQDWMLPVYTVLVPLFRETSVLTQLVDALQDIDYPAQKLDIKLIVEETDIGMQRAIAELSLPMHFEIIIVPAGKPQTKPRALNYALQFARGELLTIYDAEDVPEPDQLRKAAARFAGAPPDLACLQAELAFFNANENWLTRQFTLEYAVLFTLLLPALADHGLPLPLGGTSNHFRVAALRHVGAWDAFNVTEDADLGVRLARFGYDTKTLDSRTLEEANTRFFNWQKQRARWLKGFLFTWLVHMRRPAELWNQIGPSGFWAFQALTLGVFMSALLHPLCLIASVVLYIVSPLLGPDASSLTVGIAALNLLVFVGGYVISYIAAVRALRLRGESSWYGTLATMPLYWLMMSISAWCGLWQFVTAPFHWNKTEHGLSRQAASTRHISG